MNEENNMVTMHRHEYDDMLRKAYAMDILTSDILTKLNAGTTDTYSLIDDDLVILLTGTREAIRLRKERKRADLCSKKEEAEDA